jgi:hypothetical protein
MKIALIDIKGDDSRSIKNTTCVNIRNMLELANRIGADFYYNTAMLRPGRYNIIIFGFGAISTEINKTTEFVKNSGCDKIYWLVGEYEQSMNPALYYSCKELGMHFEIIQNYDITQKDNGIVRHFVNLNLLLSRQPNKVIDKKYDCIYYGRWRTGRSIYFKEYLREGIYLSTGSKNIKQFDNIGCTPKYISKLSWRQERETLNKFRYSLYIEDEHTHSVFNNLGNRYYEAGFCNTVVLFDINCMNTILKSELGYYIEQVKEYVVNGYAELQSKIQECNKNFDKHLAIQKTWRIGEPQRKQQVINEIKQIVSNEIRQTPYR